MINSEMLWTGSTAPRHPNGNAAPGWTDPPPPGRDAGLGDPAATTRRKVGTPTAQAATEKITVYLLDDHEIVRLGLKDLLESEGDIQVIGESGSAAHAQAQILALQPRVAVLDGRLPDGSGIEDAKKTVKNYVSSLLAKLVLQCRTQAAVFAAQGACPNSACRGIRHGPRDALTADATHHLPGGSVVSQTIPTSGEASTVRAR